MQLSRGPTPARSYLDEMIFDLVVHSWDLGTAIGYPDARAGRARRAGLRRRPRTSATCPVSGLFDAPVDVPDDASTLDKLVALTGRDPR